MVRLAGSRIPADADFDSIDTERISLNGKSRTTLGPRLLVTSDWHWNTAGSRDAADIVDNATLKANLDTIVDDANDNYEPHHAFVLGDIADYNLSSSESELITWLGDAKDYFESSAGSSGSGIDCEVTYLLGDHEYGYAGSGDMQNVFDVFGWADESESWGSTFVNGVKCLHLNTGKDEAPNDGTVEAKRIPPAEQTFIADEMTAAEELGSPTVSLSHVPLWGGVLGEPPTKKDNLVNGPAMLREVNEYSTLKACFAGHLHHETQFDRVREVLDPWGTSHFVNPTPNAVIDDVSKTPWTRATLLADGSLMVDCPVSGVPYATEWTTGGGDTRRSTAQGAFVDHSLHVDYSVPDTVSGWATPSSEGTSGVDAASGAIELSTGASGGSTEALAKRKPPDPTGGSGNPPQYHNDSFDGVTALRVGAEIVSSGASFEINCLFGGGPSSKHIGLTNTDGDLYLDVHDGSSRNQTQLSSGGFFSAGVAFSGYVVSWGGVITEYWEQKPIFDSVGSFDDGSTTSNVPNGERDSDDLIHLSATTNEASDVTVRFHAIEGFVSYPGEPFALQVQSPETQ